MTTESTVHDLDILFNGARTYTAWLDKPVDAGILKQIYDLAKMAPTSANNQPMHVVFVTSKEGKEKLKPCLDAGNVEKTMSAPATAIIGYDSKFQDQLHRWWPHGADKMKAMYDAKPQLAYETAFRNGSLQGGYFILAARALGLDCGPMSGFDNGKVDAAFFADSSIKSNFLCNLGHGDAGKLYPRGPRPGFDEYCAIV
jgi:3-hydroxypropanoate dehydrogenase